MKTVLTALYNLIAGMNPVVRMVLAIGTVAMAVNAYINELWAELFSRVDAMAAGSIGAANFSPLGLINYLFPLDTMLTMLSAYATLRVTCATVRIIKSFIPTIS